MTIKELEKRLAAVERELAQLKRAQSEKKGNKVWLKMFGKFAGDAGYKAMVSAGKKWRKTENQRKD